jgi:hypothetical protein
MQFLVVMPTGGNHVARAVIPGMMEMQAICASASEDFADLRHLDLAALGCGTSLILSPHTVGMFPLVPLNASAVDLAPSRRPRPSSSTRAFAFDEARITSPALALFTVLCFCRLRIRGACGALSSSFACLADGCRLTLRLHHQSNRHGVRTGATGAGVGRRCVIRGCTLSLRPRYARAVLSGHGCLDGKKVAGCYASDQFFGGRQG